MSFWVITSWVFVAILSGINIFIFLKLKGASEQMLKMAFPGAKDMGDAMSQMQNMMGQMQARGGQKGLPPGKDAQLKAAMDMLARSQKGQNRR